MKFRVFLLLITFSNIVFAIDGWSLGKISEIRIQSSYNRILITQENAVYPEKCSKTDYFYLPVSDEAVHKSMYAALLAAQSTGRDVNLGLTGCTTASRAIITDVVLK